MEIFLNRRIKVNGEVKRVEEYGGLVHGCYEDPVLTPVAAARLKKAKPIFATCPIIKGIVQLDGCGWCQKGSCDHHFPEPNMVREVQMEVSDQVV